jgi:hypothetical protein
MIFALVPISVLLIACMQLRWGWLVPLALGIAMLYEDVHWIRRPGEGWQVAAAQLAVAQAKDADCSIFAPRGARTMYLFFEPQLRVCDENTLTVSGTVALALSPDQYESVYAEARRKLERAGFTKVADARVAEPRLELYRRPY